MILFSRLLNERNSLSLKVFSSINTGDVIVDPDPDPDPTPTIELKNNEAVQVSGAKSEEKRFTIKIPSGASSLNVAISGGSGDADMYVKYATVATTEIYDCRPYQDGNNESCDFATANAGTYHVMLLGYSDFANVSLTATWSTDTGGGTPGCSNTEAWSATKSYTPGEVISYEGSIYESTYWSTGSIPGSAGAWATWKKTGNY